MSDIKYYEILYKSGAKELFSIEKATEEEHRKITKKVKKSMEGTKEANWLEIKDGDNCLLIRLEDVSRLSSKGDTHS